MPLSLPSTRHPIIAIQGLGIVLLSAVPACATNPVAVDEATWSATAASPVTRTMEVVTQRIKLVQLIIEILGHLRYGRTVSQQALDTGAQAGFDISSLPPGRVTYERIADQWALLGRIEQYHERLHKSFQLELLGVELQATISALLAADNLATARLYHALLVFGHNDVRIQAYPRSQLQRGGLIRRLTDTFVAIPRLDDLFDTPERKAELQTCRSILSVVPDQMWPWLRLATAVAHTLWANSVQRAHDHLPALPPTAREQLDNLGFTTDFLTIPTDPYDDSIGSRL